MTTGTLAPVPAKMPGNGGQDLLGWLLTTGDEVGDSAAHAGGAAYVGSYDGYLYAVDETDGTEWWRHRCQRGVVSRPLPASEVVILGSEDHNVCRLSRQQSRAVWCFRSRMAVRSSPQGDDRTCFIGCDDWFLYRLEWTRGTVLGRYRTWGPSRPRRWWTSEG